MKKVFPKEGLFFLTDQIRRSSRAIAANIAEAWHKRKYQAHFVSKLTDSGGEQAETRHWLDTALACGYVASDIHQRLLGECLEIGRMPGRMIAGPQGFCSRSKFSA